MKKILLPLLIILAIFLGIYFLFLRDKKIEKNDTVVSNFSDCVREENIVRESYPRQCVSKNGEVFVENIGNELEKIDLIKTSSPRPNQNISSPLEVLGEARGTWYFEGSFPVALLNSKGDIISQTVATAKSEWMTENFVSFSTTLEFEKQESGTYGKLLLKKDNPSGLPENDDTLEIPVIFE